MQDPEVLVMIELLAIRRCKLPSEDPQLPATLGYHHSLSDKVNRLGESQDSTDGLSMASSISTTYPESQGPPQPLPPASKGKLPKQTFPGILIILRDLTHPCFPKL